MTRFEKAERKGLSRGPGRVQAICVVSDLGDGCNFRERDADVVRG